MTATLTTEIQAVVFDCDGVIVDSEGLTNAVMRDTFAAMGWHLSVEECMAMFSGHALRDRAHVITEHTGVAIDDAWLAAFRERRDAALRARLEVIPGAERAVADAARTFSHGVALASGADRGKIELQLAKVGMADAFGEHVFSGLEYAATKPAPDVYLAAFAALGVDAARTVVIEDTVAGVTAGVAAGARVWGYAPGDATHTDASALIAAGAETTFRDMATLVPQLLATGAPPVGR